MARQTKNYNLILPAQEDFYNVDDFNGNAEKLDNQLYVQEQEIIGIGNKLDVVGQNVITNGTNIKGVDTKTSDMQKKLDMLNKKLGISTDTGSDTIFGVLANQNEKVYVPNKNSVKITIPQTYLKETEGHEFGGHLVLSHFTAEANGYIYVKTNFSQGNGISGHFKPKVISGFVAEALRNAPPLTLYQPQIVTEVSYTCPENSLYLDGAVLYVEKGRCYDFIVECYRANRIWASFDLCYDIRTVGQKGE